VAHKKAMEDIIREIAGYAGADDALALAQEMSMVMEGAYVTQQVTGNPKTAEIARRLVERILERHIPNGR
jgi:hypothetical protein